MFAGSNASIKVQFVKFYLEFFSLPFGIAVTGLFIGLLSFASTGLLIGLLCCC